MIPQPTRLTMRDLTQDMVLSELSSLLQKNQQTMTERQFEVFSVVGDVEQAVSRLTDVQQHLQTAGTHSYTSHNTKKHFHIFLHLTVCFLPVCFGSDKVMRNGGVKVRALLKKQQKLQNLQSVMKNFKVLYKLSVSCQDLISTGDYSLAGAVGWLSCVIID